MNCISQYKLDALFWHNYRKMNGKPFDAMCEDSTSLVIALKYLFRRSGRFLFLLRLAYQFKSLKWERFVLSFLNWNYSCDISAGCEIAAPAFFPHPIGIVIGGGTVICPECIIFNDITIGKKRPGISGPLPVINKRVFVFPGSRLLGGIEIGPQVIVGANAVVTKDVESNTTVVGYNQVLTGNYFHEEN